MKILHVVGARPNFMKVAPLLRAMPDMTNIVVHTGQHYDTMMSDAFFRDLDMPEPAVHLEVGSGSHAVQTARILERFEPVVVERQPDLVIVVGDVNSTMGAAIVCAKLLVPVAHVEAGLRSFDRTMPEEINRVVTDQLSDLLFTTSPEAEENLIREGIAPERIHFVGNTMIDSLDRQLERAASSPILDRLGLAETAYGVVTLHRPSNVDDPSGLRRILAALREASRMIPLVFAAHPRTQRMMRTSGLEEFLSGDVRRSGVTIVDPLGYSDFIRLIASARLVITDSGGIQEETTILGVPCLTLRENTERPITITYGTNRLIGTDPTGIGAAVASVLDASPGGAMRPPLWDGKAGERIADVVTRWGTGRASLQPSSTR